MLDNEQDVQIEESSTSEAQQPAPEQTQETESAAAGSDESPEPSKEAAPKETPFHEHPRFREVIEQKNKFADELRQAQLASARMQAQLDLLTKQREPAPQKDAMLERLDSIDPDFARYMRDLKSRADSVDKLKADIDELRGYRQTQEATSTYNQAMETVNKLHGEFKVPKELQEFYQARIERVANSNPNLKVSDLPATYKRIHEEFNGYLEAQKRQNLAGYVQDKTKEAKAPGSQPKGKTVGTKKQEYSKNPEEAKAQLIKNVLSQVRGAKDI